MEARFYEKLDGERVRCVLCHQRCLIAEGKRGACGVRENRGGVLYSLVYGRAIAANIDPVEKKPLFHFLPGTSSFSLATVGCNFACKNCQNADISQGPRESGTIIGRDLPPEAAVREAKRCACLSISYTYTEPTVYFEYAFAAARLARAEGIRNIFVTNGYMSSEALQAVSPYLDAANVDLKFFRDDSYRKICGARLEPVLDNIRRMRRLGIWVEVTTLVIPDHNDSDGELKEIAGFIKETGPEIPWHVSAFHPTYRLTSVGRTPAATLARARKIGLEAGLRYVYTGNIPGDEGENTFCHQCRKLIIERMGFQVGRVRLHNGKCEFCGAPAAGVWK